MFFHVIQICDTVVHVLVTDTPYDDLVQSLQQSLVHLHLSPHLHWSPAHPLHIQGQHPSLQSVVHLQLAGLQEQTAGGIGEEGGTM